MRSSRIIALVTLVVSGGGCFELFPCENADVHRVASPDGELEVVSFTRDCGATTAMSYHVSVLPAGESLPSEGGNTFVAGHPEDRGAPVQEPLVGWRGDSVHVFFISPREVFKQEAEVAGRPVLYEKGDEVDIAL